MKPTSPAVTRYRFAEGANERPRTTLQLEVAVLEQRSHAIEMPTGGPKADGFTVLLPHAGSASDEVGSQEGSQANVAHVLSIVSPTFGAFAGIGSRLKPPETMPIEGSPATSGGEAAPLATSTQALRTTANRERRIFIGYLLATTCRQLRPRLSRVAQTSAAAIPPFVGVEPPIRMGRSVLAALLAERSTAVGG